MNAQVALVPELRDGPKRAGYYVEGMYFGERLHQARARATYLAMLYGRGIDILYVGHSIAYPSRPEVAMTVFSDAHTELPASNW